MPHWNRNRNDEIYFCLRLWSLPIVTASNAETDVKCVSIIKVGLVDNHDLISDFKVEGLSFN